MAFYPAIVPSVIMMLWILPHTSCDSVQLLSHNIDGILKSNDLVLVNFYAKWCRFSQMLEPVYDSAASKIKQEFPTEGKVVFGKVDCDLETSIAHQYHVSKYPTLKMFRHGSLVKKEYRGQRSADAISEFVRKQLTPPVAVVQNLDLLDGIDASKRHIIGYFDSETSPDYESFKKVASVLRDACQFHASFGVVAEPERTVGNKLVYQGDGRAKMVFTGHLSDYDNVMSWCNDKCTPLVREITFENAESKFRGLDQSFALDSELTEEGLPFVILFHSPKDTATPEKYRDMVSRQLLAEKTSVNFLTADGHQFSHPLHHLGKTIHDLPVVAIDSFRHMYVWPRSPRDSFNNADLLKQFIADLHSGKLHREFHNGPDPTTSPAPKLPEAKHVDNEAAASADKNTDVKPDSDAAKVTHHMPKDPPAPDVRQQPREKVRNTQPPPSMFNKLAPSRTRYTLLRDEL